MRAFGTTLTFRIVLVVKETFERPFRPWKLYVKKHDGGSGAR